jgi:hypothetical protein
MFNELFLAVLQHMHVISLSGVLVINELYACIRYNYIVIEDASVLDILVSLSACVEPRPSPEYECGKRNPLYLI